MTENKEPIHYLTSKEAAEHLGIHPGTWQTYQTRGSAPQPDVIVGKIRGWSREALDNWQAERRRKRPVD